MKGERNEDLASWNQGIEEHLERAVAMMREIERKIKAIKILTRGRASQSRSARRDWNFEQEILEQKVELFEKQAKAPPREHFQWPSATKLPKLFCHKV